jgi:hypothetical protein
MWHTDAPVAPEHAQAIGRVTVNFALLEHIVSSFIWGFLGDQLKGEIVTAELSFRSQVALLSSLHKHCVNDPQKNAELEELLKRALSLEEKRNIIVHSYWGTGSKDDTITRLKTTAKISKGLQHQLEEVSVGDLDRIADEIGVLSFDVQSFMNPEFGKGKKLEGA